MSRDGIRCPKCNCPHSYVRKTFSKDVTYHGRTRTITRRYRTCGYCGYYFSTNETIDPDDELPDNVKPKETDNPYL